jgi:hypothetical protein
MEFSTTDNMTGNTSKDVHLYEVRPRKDRRGFDLISDALPFRRLWSRAYGKTSASSRFRTAERETAPQSGRNVTLPVETS